jgi:hypothetical protein
VPTQAAKVSPQSIEAAHPLCGFVLVCHTGYQMLPIKTCYGAYVQA